MRLDLILPCFNPLPGWENTVIRSFNNFKGQLKGFDETTLILINDGSTKGVEDGQINKIRQKIAPCSLVYYRNRLNRGKGHAVREGMQRSRGDLAVYTDIDFPYTTKSMVRLVNLLQTEAADIAAGVRDETYYAQIPPMRKRISKWLRVALRTFLRLEITDTQCGLKGFNSKGRNLFLQTRIDRFLFDMEFIFLASNDESVSLAPCEVELKPDVVFSKVNWAILLRESINFMGIFILFLKQKLFGKRRK